MKAIPTFEEFNGYAAERIKKDQDNPELYTEFIRAKYDAWELAGWKKEIKGKFVPITIWQTTLIQALIHRQPNKVKNHTVRAEVIAPREVKHMELPESKENAVESLKLAYDEYKNRGQVSVCYAGSFDRLYEWGILPPNEDEKAKKYYDAMLRRAHVFVHFPLRQKYERVKSADLHDTKEGKALLEEVKKTNDYNHPQVQNKFRCYVLEDYFKKYEWNIIRNKIK